MYEFKLRQSHGYIKKKKLNYTTQENIVKQRNVNQRDVEPTL